VPRLYLIRHGETRWSLTGQHTGRTDLPLTPHGEDEGRALVPCLSAVRFTRVLTSPRLRARQTCALAGLSSAAEIEPALAEWDYGTYEGERTTDIDRERPDWVVWRDGCPEGETPPDVSERADRLLLRLRPLEGNIALFSHGQFGAALAVRWIGLPLINGQHFTLGPASLSILGAEPGHPAVPAIELWNAMPAAP
jgi:probable phosphoglycerate mutase